VPVLTELWKQMGDAPVKVDLDGWWKRLGIAKSSGRLVFDDSAPLAALRRAVTAAP
jgi:outer membrane biosynthesis protein TonB